MKALDLGKIPFFSFIISYSLILVFIIVGSVVLDIYIPDLRPLFWGIYSSFFLQYSSMAARIFCLNLDWAGPIFLQYLIMILTFFINIGVLFLFAQHEKNILLIIGFFIAYFINLKVVVFVAYKYSKKEEESD